MASVQENGANYPGYTVHRQRGHRLKTTYKTFSYFFVTDIKRFSIKLRNDTYVFVRKLFLSVPEGDRMIECSKYCVELRCA